MTTESKETPNVHEAAKLGFSDGSNYNKHRPGYADEAIQEVLRITRVPYNNHEYEWEYLELGAGTGKFTSLLTKQLAEGTTYLATEPSPGFYKILTQNCSSLETRQCSADDIPVPDKSVKNVLAVQSFHWFATPRSLREIHRVLVPGGNLVLLWNRKDYSIDWVRELKATFRSELEGIPDYRNERGYMLWKKVFDELNTFELISEIMLKGPMIQGSRDYKLNHYSSISVIAKAQKERQEKIFTDMKKILQTHPALTGSDVITIPMQSHLMHFKSK